MKKSTKKLLLQAKHLQNPVIRRESGRQNNSDWIENELHAEGAIKSYGAATRRMKNNDDVLASAPSKPMPQREQKFFASSRPDDGAAKPRHLNRAAQQGSKKKRFLTFPLPPA